MFVVPVIATPRVRFPFIVSWLPLMVLVPVEIEVRVPPIVRLSASVKVAVPEGKDTLPGYVFPLLVIVTLLAGDNVSVLLTVRVIAKLRVSTLPFTERVVEIVNV